MKYSSRTALPLIGFCFLAILVVSLAPPKALELAEAQTTLPPRTPSESVQNSSAQQVNDPTGYLRRFDLDTDFNWVNYDRLGYKITPGVFTPVGESLRLRIAAPFYVKSPGDNRDVRLGDVYTGITWIPYTTKHYAPFLGMRLELPTGEAAKGAGLGVTQITPAAGVVIYSLLKYGLLLAPVLQYKQTIFESETRPKVSTFVFRPNLIFFPSPTAYARADWTITSDSRTNGRTASRLLLEIGNIFAKQYKVALGYEWDLWNNGDNTVTETELGRATKVGTFKLGLSYLF